MKERPTPRIDATVHKNKGLCFHGMEFPTSVTIEVGRTLEQQLWELRETYDLDTQMLRAERDQAQERLRKCHNEYIEVSHDREAQVETLKAENAANTEQLSLLADLFGYDDTIGGESLAVYMARMVGRLRNENAALRDALRVRLSGDVCRECEDWFMVYGDHSENCRHYRTEREVTQ